MPHRTKIRRRRSEDPTELEDARAVATPAEAVLALQRAHGNQAVQQILARNGTLPVIKPPKDRFADAVKADDWAAAVSALDELPDTEVQTLLKPLSNEQLGKLQTAAGEYVTVAPWLTDRILRNVVFRLRPAPETIPTKKGGYTPSGGKEEYAGEVEGGDISVKTGVDLTKGGKTLPGAFTLGYKGEKSGQTRWLQFISREIEVHPKVGEPKFLDNLVGPPTGFQYKLSSPTERHWNTDAQKGAKSPFYEDTGAQNRTEDATSMFDIPSSYVQLVTPQFSEPVSATKVISRARFVTYLIRDMEILEKIEIDVVWEYTKPGEVPRTHNVAARGKVANLDPAHRERIATQFPAFNYLP